MRELLFKGKAKGTGEWISGGYLQRAEAKYYFKKDQALIHCYISSDWTTYFGLPSELTIHEVESSTICQYTGLTDKNGKKIFEGDIVRYGEICGEVKFGLHESNWQICKYNQGFYIEFPEESLYRKELGYWENKVVVIGNIYDSPKLLEDKENKHGEDI